jgi:peptidoglycan-N-acetylglucosamine deacetylase
MAPLFAAGVRTTTNVRDHHFVLRHALAPVFPPAADALGIPRTLETGENGVALTFDDGPHPEGTPAILEVLARAGHKATFFMIGEQVERRPELAREVVEQGHAIALHGYRHRLQLRLTPAQLEGDIARGLEAITSATATQPLFHRPPYGIYSAAGLTAARSAGLSPILWSRWGKDWRKFTTPERIARRATRRIAPADVILLHDADFYSAKNSHERAVKALELIIAELKSREIATVLCF